jgi:hypothetical protein
MWQNGGDLISPELQELRQHRKFPSFATCNRWIRQFNEEGHTWCKRPTGNHISQREVHEQDLFNLSLYRIVRPKAYLDEVRAYVHNQNPVNPPYLQSQIYRAERRLGLVRKAASTTSDCAYFEANLSSASSTGMLNFQMAYKERAQGTSSILMRVIINWRRKIGSLGR